MATSILTFGKFKGQDYFTTPSWYQEWLKKQDWFKVPVKMDDLALVQQEMSKVSNQLKGWNGHSSRGQASYDRMFELEQMESDIMYCNCGRFNEPGLRNCGLDCGY
jgi:uncharacterized protein (DUF3820 family)